MDNRSFLVAKDMVIPLSPGAAIVLGRDAATCNHVLADERVSRVHTMVFHKDGKYTLKDLNSSNGTYLNGKRVSGAPLLSPGDVIEIRPFTFEFVSPDPSQTSTQVPAASLVVAAKGKAKMEGPLSTLSVSDLIQMLNATLQSGVLTVTDGKEATATFVLQDGEVAQAAYEGKSGEEAFFSAMRIREGRFEFTKTEPPDRSRAESDSPQDKSKTATFEKQILRRTQSLLLEGARLMDEAAG